MRSVSTLEDLPKAIEAELAFYDWTAAGEELQQYYVTVLSDAALGAYSSGEMDLRSVLDLVDKVAQRCRGIQRDLAFADTAKRALAIVPGKRKRGPGHPRWVKNVAVDLIELYHQHHLDLDLSLPDHKPDPNKRCVLQDVAEILARLRLCPLNTPTIGAPLKPGDVGPMISMKTLHRWYRERKQAQGDSSGRARARKRKGKRLP